MADSTLHFTLGLALGTCLFLPAVIRKITVGEKASLAVGKMLAYSYALAVFAIIPNLLRHAGVPGVICNGWWMNIFLLSPLLDQLKPGGMLIGEIMIVVFFALHYSSIIAALLKIKSREQIMQQKFSSQ